MSRAPRWTSLPAIALAGGLLTIAVPARADGVSYIDLNAGLGYSSNPLLQINGKSSAFGRISANGFHSWESEHSATWLSAYVENTTYLKDYGSKQIVDVNAHTTRSVSPMVTLFGDLGFSTDFAGQLSNRFTSVPSGPVLPPPPSPLPPPSTIPDLLGFSGRQYRINGDIGASIRSGARSTVSLTAGVQRTIFTRSLSDASYTTYRGSVGYDNQLSQRTSVGATVYLQRQDFKGGNASTLINPVVRLRSTLREQLEVSASAGVMAIEQDRLGQKDHSVSPSFSASLCSTGTVSRLCGRIARDARVPLAGQVAGGGGETVITTTAGFDYFRHLGPADTLQASVSAAHYSPVDAVLLTDRIRSTYVSALASYDRKIGARLSAGASVGARQLYERGPDPDFDLNGSLYLRYRIGDAL